VNSNKVVPLRQNNSNDMVIAIATHDTCTVRGFIRYPRVILASAMSILIVFLLIFFTTYYYEQLTAYRATKAKLHAIWLGIINSEDRDGNLPPARRHNEQGKPLSSWRFQIYPRLESPAIVGDLSAAWDAPVNSSIRELRSFRWFHFSESATTTDIPGATNVMALVGKDTAFDPKAVNSTDMLPPNLMVLITVSNTGVHWMQPGDVDVCNLIDCRDELRSCIDSPFADRIYVVFADGEVWGLSVATPMDKFIPFLTKTKAVEYSREELLSEYRLH